MTSISTLGQSLNQAERLLQVQQKLAELQTQLTTGKKTERFDGLGTDVVTSKRARANFKALDLYSNNITIADRRIKIALNSVQEFQTQSRNIVNAIEIQTQEGEIEIESIRDLTANLRPFLENLINTQDGDRYLFAGADSLNQPLDDNGTLDTTLQAQIDDWLDGNLATEDFITAYNGVTDEVIGYSPALSSGTAKNVYVRADEGTDIDYTVFANDPGFREIYIAVSTLEKLLENVDEITLDADDDPTTTVVPPGTTLEERSGNFFDVFNDLARTINAGLDKLDVAGFNLAQTQSEITQIQQNHKIEQNIIQETISNVEDVDINQVAVELNSLQIQLEASYRITASVRDLSLVNFI